MIIYKYALDYFNIKTVLSLPLGAKVIHLGTQLHHNQQLVPTIWVQLDKDELKKKDRTFVVVGTGTEFTKSAQYVGTYFGGPYVWHVLEIT